MLLFQWQQLVFGGRHLCSTLVNRFRSFKPGEKDMFAQSLMNIELLIGTNHIIEFYGMPNLDMERGADVVLFASLLLFFDHFMSFLKGFDTIA